MKGHTGNAAGGAGRRGSVIVVVLVTLLFAALLLTRLIENSSPDLIIAMRVADGDRLRADAHAALETTLAALVDFRTVDGGLYSPDQGWADPLGYAGYAPRAGVAVEVAFEDESAKLSLPRLGPDALGALLAELGLGAPEAARVADALAGWMRSGHIAAEAATSAGAYERGDPPARPPYRPLRSFEELAAVAVARDYFYGPDGQPKPLLDGFKAAVSLYQFNATNLNSAPPTVLAASGWDPAQTEALERYRTAPLTATKTRPFFRSVQEARRLVGNAAGSNLGAQIQCLRITVTVREGAAQLKLAALVTWSGQAARPGAAVAAGDPGAGPAAPAGAAGRNAVSTSANALRYPYAVLEISETTLPDPPPSPDAPAA